MIARRLVVYGAIASTFLCTWEGTDLTAKPDRLAYGLITFCNGSTTYDDPTVKIGDKFTTAQCAARLAKSLPKYAAPLFKCIHGEPSNHAFAAFLSGAYNAGPAAMCRSPMVAAFNAGNKNFCDKFVGWYERAGGKWRQGLHNRRLAEAKLCKTPDAPVASKWNWRKA